MKLAHIWRRGLVIWAFLSLISMQIIESTHHHESEVLQEACAVCQMVAHQQLDLLTSTVVTLTPMLVLLFLVFLLKASIQIAETRYISYTPRAPPNPSA